MNKIAKNNAKNRKLIHFETQINSEHKKMLTEKLDVLGKIAKKIIEKLVFIKVKVCLRIIL